MNAQLVWQRVLMEGARISWDRLTANVMKASSKRMIPTTVWTLMSAQLRVTTALPVEIAPIPWARSLAPVHRI